MIKATFISSLSISILVFLISFIGDNIQWAFFSMLVAFVISLVLIILLGIPLLLTLKNYNKLNWQSILIGGFLIGFIIPMSSWFINPELNIKSLQHIVISLGVGLIGLFASAVFYKVYKNNKQEKHMQ